MAVEFNGHKFTARIGPCNLFAQGCWFDSRQMLLRYLYCVSAAHWLLPAM